MKPSKTSPRNVRFLLLATASFLALSLSACILSDSKSEPEIGNGGTIELGQTKTGSITSDKYAWKYTFTLTETKMIIISMEAINGEIDPFLELRDSNNMLIASDDDGYWEIEYDWESEDLDAAIRTVLVPGTYTIVAMSFENAYIEHMQMHEDVEISVLETGDFALSLRADAVGNGGTIAVGGNASNTIDDTTHGWLYTLTVPATAVLTIDLEMTSGTLDAYLAVYNSSNTLVTANDDGGTGSNSRIQYTFTAGTYTIFATRYDEANGTSSGNFLLTVTQ